jgi:hypothetical protein
MNQCSCFKIFIQLLFWFVAYVQDLNAGLVEIQTSVTEAQDNVYAYNVFRYILTLYLFVFQFWSFLLCSCECRRKSNSNFFILKCAHSQFVVNWKSLLITFCFFLQHKTV